MKNYLAITLGTLIIVSVLGSCTKPEEQAMIDYYITADESIDFESLNLTFEYTRAYTRTEEGNEAVRSVYLDRQELSLSTDGLQEPIFLGSSDIESNKVYGYNFSFSYGSVIRGGKDVNLEHKRSDESNKVEKEFSLTPNEIKKIVFVIKTDESISELADGKLKFLAKIEY